ncbi:hypothetical protein D3C73_1633000 [compost metagenome]
MSLLGSLLSVSRYLRSSSSKEADSLVKLASYSALLAGSASTSPFFTASAIFLAFTGLSQA